MIGYDLALYILATERIRLAAARSDLQRAWLALNGGGR